MRGERHCCVRLRLQRAHALDRESESETEYQDCRAREKRLTPARSASLSAPIVNAAQRSASAEFSQMDRGVDFVARKGNEITL